MPRIITPQSDPTLPRPVFSGEQFGALQGRALEGLGQDVSRIGARIGAEQEKRRQLKEQSEISQINQELARRKADLLIEQRRVFEEGDPADEALGQAFLAKADATLGELRNFGRTDGARQFAEEQINSALSSFRVSTDAEAARLAGVRRAEEFTSATQSLSAAVVSTPDFYEDAVAQIDSSIAYLLPAERQATSMREHAALVEARVEGLILQRNPQQAFEELKAGRYDSRIDGDTKARLMRAAQSAVKAEKDYTLGLLKLEFEDDLGQIALTGDPGRWSPELAAALGGDNPVEGRRLRRAFEQSLAVGQASAAYAEMPLGDILADVEASQQGLATAEEFKTAEAAATAKAQAAKRIFESYRADPAGAALQRSQPAAQAFTQFQERPDEETFARYAAVVEAQQRRDGIETPRILPKSYVENVRGNLALTGEAGDSERAARFVGDLAGATGRWWPKVARDLYDQGALTREQLVAANLTQKAPSLARELFDVSALKDEELKALAPSASARQSAAQKARGALEPFLATLPPRDLEVGNGYVEALGRLVLVRQARGETMSPSKVTALAKKMVLDEYSIRGTVRIPKGLSANTIQRSLNQEKAALSAAALVSPGGVGNYAERVRAAGYWITNPEETGALLVDEVGNRVFERGPDGRPRPVVRTWDQLNRQTEPVRADFNAL